MTMNLTSLSLLDQDGEEGVCLGKFSPTSGIASTQYMLAVILCQRLDSVYQPPPPNRPVVFNTSICIASG